MCCLLMAAVLKTASTSLGVTSAPTEKDSSCQSMAEAALIGMNVQQASATIHVSTLTVHGFRCTCPEGFTLEEDLFTCIDRFLV